MALGALNTCVALPGVATLHFPRRHCPGLISLRSRSNVIQPLSNCWRTGGGGASQVASAGRLRASISPNKDFNNTSIESDQLVKSSVLDVTSNEQSDADLNEEVSFTTLQTALRSYFTEVQEGWQQIQKDPNPAAALGDVFRKELKIIYLMTSNDITVAMLPFLCIGVNLLAVSPFLEAGDFPSFSLQAVTTLGKEISYAFLFLYPFNLANQHKGVPGDAIDKPYRPIPSGLLTREGALARCLLTSLLYGFVSWELGVLPWTLLWQFVVASTLLGVYEKDESSFGLGRSASMVAAALVMAGAGASLVTKMTPTLLWWAVMRGALFGNHHWMQDFRDMEGDRKIGRTTFPLLFGVERARKLMAFIFMMDPFFIHFVVMKDSVYSTPQLVLEGVGAILCSVLAYRVMNMKTRGDDKETYTIWLATYWQNYTFLLLGPAFLQGLQAYF